MKGVPYYVPGTAEVERLKSGDSEARLRARAELIALGPQVIPMLFDQLGGLGKASISDNLSSEENSRAALAIEEIKHLLREMGSEIAPILVGMLGSSAGHYAAAVFDEHYVAAIPLLVNACRSPNLGVRRNAISALRYTCLSAETSLPEVTQTLLGLTLDSDGEVRGKAADTLLDLCGARRQMVERYRKWLRDSSHLVRVCGIRALGALSLDDDLPALVGLLKDGDSSVRRCALDSIAKYGPRAQNAITAIRSIFDREKDGYCGDAARDALNKIEGGPR